MAVRILSLYTFLCCAVLISNGIASADSPFRVKRNSITGKIQYIENKEVRSSNLSARQKSSKSDYEKITRDFLQNVYQQNGEKGFFDEDNLELESISTDHLGLQHVRFRQLYKGTIPVYGSEVVAHFGRDAQVNSAFLQILSENELGIDPVLSAADAIRLTKQLFKQNKIYKSVQSLKRRQIKLICFRKYPEIHVVRRSSCFRKRLRRRRKELKPFVREEARLLVYSKDFLKRQIVRDAKLVWKIELMNSSEFQQDTYFIDATSGEIIDIQHGIQGLNRLIYDFSNSEGVKELDVPHLYTFENIQVQYTHGRSEGKPVRGPVPVMGPMLGSTDVDDFYSELAKLDEYYRVVLQRNGANRLGGLVTGSPWVGSDKTAIYTHVDNSAELYQYCESSDSFAGPHYIAFCSTGNSSDYDTLGHEYAHFMARNLGILLSEPPNRTLIDTGESGAILEAFADFFGEAYERYRNNGQHDWKIESETPDRFKRDMSDPSASFDNTFSDQANIFPEHYSDRNFNCGSANDRDETHLNSIVMSKAFHLMSEGTGSGTYNGCKVQGIGFGDVEKILYYALHVYLSETSTFPEAYDAIMDACEYYSFFPQFGITSADCENVDIALQALMIDQDGYCVTQNDSVRATCASDEPVESIPGDYDRDLDVDYDDYLRWKNTEGDNVAPGSGADGNSDGIINEDDYTIWMINVGRGLTGTLAGDYNRDGSVSDLDYQLWRRMYGSSPAENGLGADGNADGRVDAADYSVWRDHLPPKRAGDYDQDGDVDQDDYLKWRSCYGAEATGDCKSADGNGDGTIDAADYSIWRDNLE